MARRNNSSTSTNEAQEADVSTTDTEAPEATDITQVTTPTQATDAPEATDAEGAEATAPKPKPEANITPFVEAAESAIEARDTSTGDVPVPNVEAVVKSYRELENAVSKRAAKKHVGDSMLGAMVKEDFGLARAWLSLQQGVEAVQSVSSGVTRAPVDPTDAYVERVVGLALAAKLSKSVTPDGVSESWNEKANELVATASGQADEYLAWAQRPAVAEGEEDAAEPTVPEFVKASVKLALGKSAKVGTIRKGAVTSSPRNSTYSGPRRDVAKHISEAFGELESGAFLTVNQIRAFKSSEYDVNEVSAGAISSRLKSAKGVPGFQPSTNESGRFGAVKE